MKLFGTVFLVVSFFVGAGSLSASPAEPDFYRDVYPFLKANCISCHNKTTTKADLNMETPELMIKGGDSGPSIIPGKSGESLLVEASTHEFDLEMPPKNNKTDAANLTKAEIGILKTWIDQGAKSSVQEVRKVVWQPLAKGVHPIYTLAMSGDGRFAACGRSNQIYLYDLARRKFVSQIVDKAEKPAGAHKALVYSLAFSPDGNRLASGGFREVKIWKKKEASGLNRKADPSLAATVSTMTPDGSKIVAADKSGALHILNAADGKLLKKIDGVAKTPTQLLSVSPDNESVAVFADAWHLSVWNLKDGKLLALRDIPDDALAKEKDVAEAKSKTATAAETATNAAIQKAQSAKDAAAQKLAAAKALAAKEPNPENQKTLAEANTNLVAATQALTKTSAAHKVSQTNKTAAEKAAQGAVAKLNQARKVKVNAMIWSADGKSIATAGDDKIVKVWPLPAAPAIAIGAPMELTGSAGTIHALAAGKGKIAAANQSNKIRIWELPSGKVIKEIAAAGVLAFDLSPDGKTIATAGADGGIRILDAVTGKQILDLREETSDVDKIADFEWKVAREVLEQAFQKTEVARIAAQDKGLDDLIKKAKDDVVAMNKSLPVKQKAVKPAQDAEAAAKKKVDEAAAALAKAEKGSSTTALEKALKDAKDKLITAEIKLRSAQTAVKAVEVNIADSGTKIKRMTDTKAENAKELAAINAATAASKKSQTKATTDLAAAKADAKKSDGKALDVCFSKDGTEVAAVFEKGELKVWGVPTGIPIGTTAGNAATKGSLVCAADGTFAACSNDAALTRTPSDSKWELERVLGGEGEDGLPLFTDRVNAVQFSPDGKTLATGGGEPSRTGDIVLLDVATGKATAVWEDKHDDCVVSLDFSPDGKLLASGATDKIAKVFKIANGERVNIFEGHTHHVMDVSFRADGRVLATAGADGVVNAWDMILGERKKKIEGWTKEVTSLQFIGATDQIVTSAGDNLIRIVRDNGGQVRSIAKLPDFMQAAASTPDGATIIGGGEDSFLRVWDGTNGKELAAFGTQ